MVTVAVAGAGGANVAATAAVNLALGLASLGLSVRLRDDDAPEHHAAFALIASAAPLVDIERGGPLEIRARRIDDDAGARTDPQVVVVACPPRVDAVVADVLRSADAVAVPVDGSALSLRALDAVTAARGTAPSPVRVLLTRALPRSVDRWALVERLTERDDARLAATTVPLGRASRLGRGRGERRATLYAPTTAAARAYTRVARELAADVGLALTNAAD